jgi:hypothetical protein
MTLMAGRTVDITGLCNNSSNASVVEWPKFLAADPEIPSSIPGATTYLSSLEPGPLSLVSMNEELCERRSSGSGLEKYD